MQRLFFDNAESGVSKVHIFTSSLCLRTSSRFLLLCSSDPSKAFSRDDISKSIENLQSKWQRDERDNAKRAAATTAAKTINVTPASLDNITEV